MIRVRAASREPAPPAPDDWTHQPARPVGAGALCLILAAALPMGLAGARPDAPPISPPPDMRLDVNTATRAELMALPGIGPALSAAILEHRTAHGPFASVEALDAVRGIGPRTIDDLRPLVVAETPPKAE